MHLNWPRCSMSHTTSHLRTNFRLYDQDLKQYRETCLSLSLSQVSHIYGRATYTCSRWSRSLPEMRQPQYFAGCFSMQEVIRTSLDFFRR